METPLLITALFTFLISVAAFVIAYFQAKEKGPVFTNTYIYATKKEREEMDKKPEYRLAKIVFMMVGIAFLLITAGCITNWIVLFIAAVAVLVSTLVYAVVQAIRSEGK